MQHISIFPTAAQMVVKSATSVGVVGARGLIALANKERRYVV